jgi:hypothetical protein
MVGMSTLLTVAGGVLAMLIICFAAGPGALSAVWRVARPRRVAARARA